MKTLHILLLPLLGFIVACSPPGDSGVASPELASAAQFQLAAPSGNYKLDITHASASFSVRHLGLSNYVARFGDFDVKLSVDADNIESSTVSATINPASISTGYSGDYKGTHPKSKFSSWDEDLAMSDKFLNAGEYPEITFSSTAVKNLGGGRLSVTGDLNFRGQTHPVTFDTRIVGSVAAHPFSKKGALGLSAKTTFSRSQFGMDYLVKPGFVGDDVTLMFEGEFHQSAGE